MGKHTANTGTAANRSRSAIASRANGIVPREEYGGKGWRRAHARRDVRRRFFNDIMSKSPRYKGYKKPGSMKARTN